MSAASDEETEYGEDLIARFEFKWGEGFLSPGGSSEVLEIVQGVKVAGKTVLDFGCGLGGADLILAKECNAASVLGLDIDAGLLTRARTLAEESGLDDKVRFIKAEPGTLTFENGSFDVIFSKDAILHIDEKRWIYGEFARLLKDGGSLAISDWLAGDGDSAALQAFFSEHFHLDVVFQTSREVHELLDSIGFSDIEMIDRNEWFKELARWEVQQFSGPRNNDFIEAFGEEVAEDSISAHQKLVSLAESGQLRPTHIRARWS